MSERAKNLVALALGGAALAVIVIGLATAPSEASTPEERVASLSEQIKCPFCNGESLADSASGVAGDYRLLITEMVAEGMSDDEILDEFAANFGESYVLESGRIQYSFTLWALPIGILIAGVYLVASMRRSAQRDEEVRP